MIQCLVGLSCKHKTAQALNPKPSACATPCHPTSGTPHRTPQVMPCHAAARRAAPSHATHTRAHGATPCHATNTTPRHTMPLDRQNFEKEFFSNSFLTLDRQNFKRGMLVLQGFGKGPVSNRKVKRKRNASTIRRPRRRVGRIRHRVQSQRVRATPNGSSRIS